MSLAERLRRGEKGLTCLFVGTASPDVVEMAATAGYDFVVLDCEHGDLWPALSHMLRAARAAGIPAVVRVLGKRTDMIGQALDFGADGLLVPGLESIAEAKAAIAAARYAPLGKRGLAFSTRAAGYGRESGPGFLKQANEATAVLLQVETTGALACLDELVRLEGYEALLVGPADLSVALGEESVFTDKVEAAVLQVREACRAASRTWGIFTGSPEAHRKWREAGAHYCCTAVPNLLNPALKAWIDA